MLFLTLLAKFMPCLWGGKKKKKRKHRLIDLFWLSFSRWRISQTSVESGRQGLSLLTMSVFLQNIPEDRRVNKEDDEEEEKEEEDEGRSDEGFMGMTPLLQAHHAMEKMEEFVHKVTIPDPAAGAVLVPVRSEHICTCVQTLRAPVLNTVKLTNQDGCSASAICHSLLIADEEVGRSSRFKLLVR